MSNPTRRVLRLSSVVLESTKFYGGSYKLNKFWSFRLLKEIRSLANLACMRIFITSVGQAIAEDTLPGKYIFIMSSTHHQRNSAKRSRLDALENVAFLQVKEDKHVTSKNSTEKSEQGGLLRKTKADLKPVFACVVQTISEGERFLVLHHNFWDIQGKRYNHL